MSTIDRGRRQLAKEERTKVIQVHRQTPDLGTEAVIFTKTGDRHIATAWADFPGEWQYRDVDGSMSFVRFGEVTGWFDVIDLLGEVLHK